MVFNECSSFVCIDTVFHWKCHHAFSILLLYNWSWIICSFILQLNLIYRWENPALSTILTPLRPSKTDLESVNCKPKKQPHQGHGRKGGTVLSGSVRSEPFWAHSYAVEVTQDTQGNYIFLEQRSQCQLFNFSLTHDKARHAREKRITIKRHLGGLESPGPLRSWNPWTFTKCTATSPLCDVSLERRGKNSQGGWVTITRDFLT